MTDPNIEDAITFLTLTFDDLHRAEEEAGAFTVPQGDAFADFLEPIVLDHLRTINLVTGLANMACFALKKLAHVRDSTPEIELREIAATIAANTDPPAND